MAKSQISELLFNIYFDFVSMYKTETAMSHETDSCLKINKCYVIFGNSKFRHIQNSFPYEIRYFNSQRYFGMIVSQKSSENANWRCTEFRF